MNRWVVVLVVAGLWMGSQVSAAPKPKSAPKPKPATIQYVGAVSVNPSQDAKVLAAWYRRLGIETQEMGGGYYAQLETAAGPLFFGIHPRRDDAPAKSSGSVAVVFRVSDYDAYLAELARRKLVPRSTESDAEGRFAHFVDPDGNQVTIWGK